MDTNACDVCGQPDPHVVVVEVGREVAVRVALAVIAEEMVEALAAGPVVEGACIGRFLIAKLDQQPFQGRTLTVNEARPQARREGGGGGGGGGKFGGRNRREPRW